MTTTFSSTTTPSRISDAQHAANRLRLRELNRQIAALKVQAREIHAKHRAQWEAERPKAALALKWARALPKAERDYYLASGRLRGEPLGSTVLRRQKDWRCFCGILRKALSPPPGTPFDGSRR